jgi:hypothetical protein
MKRTMMISSIPKTIPLPIKGTIDRVAIDLSGMLVAGVCVNWSTLAEGGIPGLDANLCRCSRCREEASGGVYWVNRWMIERLLRKRSSY